jgi:outer membrane autotransporter protein
LNVAGNYSAAAGSTYQAELASGGQSDLISATGTATITSGALLQAVRFDSGTYAVGTRYTVLTATGNVSGRYTLVNGGALTAFLSVTDEYDTNNVYLRIMQSRSLAAAGITPNQISAAGALQALPSGNALLTAALSQPDDAAARRAFDQVSGEIHASIQGMLIEDSRFLRNAALDRLRESFCVLEPARDASRESHCESEPGKTTAWATTFGSWGTHSGDGNAASLSRSIGGMIAGADTALANSWRLGFLGGYSRSSFSAGERGSSGSSDNYHFGFYGGMDRTPFAVRFGGAYTWHDIATNRTVAFSGFSDRTQAAYRAATMQAFGELGYRIPLRDVLLESYANLAIVNVQSDNFAESGGAAALASRSSALDAGFTTLGLRASTSFRLGLSQAVLKGALGWRRALRNTTPTAVMNFSGGNNFAISGTPVARDVAVVDAGIDIAFSVNARLGLSYGGQFGSGADDQSLRGMLSVNF